MKLNAVLCHANLIKWIVLALTAFTYWMRALTSSFRTSAVNCNSGGGGDLNGYRWLEHVVAVNWWSLRPWGVCDWEGWGTCYILELSKITENLSHDSENCNARSFCSFGRIFAGSLSWFPDVQTLLAYVLGYFGMPSIGACAVQVTELQGSSQQKTSSQNPERVLWNRRNMER
jgi:hypothetical protein